MDGGGVVSGDVLPSWAVRRDSAGCYVLMRLVLGCYHDVAKFDRDFYAQRCAAELIRGGVE